MKACPHCGGTCGISYKARMTARRVCDWDRENDEEIELETFDAAKTGGCRECGKKVRLPDPDSAHPPATRETL